jgi:hypothetical protein
MYGSLAIIGFCAVTPAQLTTTPRCWRSRRHSSFSPTRLTMCRSTGMFVGWGGSGTVTSRWAAEKCRKKPSRAFSRPYSATWRPTAVTDRSIRSAWMEFVHRRPVRRRLPPPPRSPRFAEISRRRANSPEFVGVLLGHGRRDSALFMNRPLFRLLSLPPSNPFLARKARITRPGAFQFQRRRALTTRTLRGRLGHSTARSLPISSTTQSR